MAYLAELQNIKVNYGRNCAVDGVSFGLNGGDSLGLLGANGAGKSTTLKAMLGMVRVQTGHISILGLKPGAVRAFESLGFAPEEGTPPEYLTGREYLSFIASMRGRGPDEAGKLLEWFELVPTKKVRDYSKGMKRRLVLAQAFVGDPKLLILDEPLNGLDPLMIIKLRDRLNEARSRGSTVIYSSHILSEVEKSCNRVVVLDRGRLVCDSLVSKLVEEFGSVEAAFAAKVGRA